MASSNHTTNLGLCSWAATDRPKRADFVSDNSIIDSALGGHIADTTIHMTTAEKTKALVPFESFIYSGNGEASRTIGTTFRPAFAVVFKRGEAPMEYTGGVNVVNSAYAYYGHGGTAGLSISSTGVVVTQESAASDGRRISLNEQDCQYTLVAFK